MNVCYNELFERTVSSLCAPALFVCAVSVGYEYESCAGLILWEKRTALLQGYELDPTNLGGWSLNKQHILNTRSGTCMRYLKLTF